MDKFTLEKTYITLEHMALMLEGDAVETLRLKQKRERSMYAAALRVALELLEKERGKSEWM